MHAMHAMHAISEIGQRCIHNVYDINNITFNAAAKEHKPKSLKKERKDRSSIERKEEDLIKPTKHASITCFYKNITKVPRTIRSVIDMMVLQKMLNLEMQSVKMNQ